MSVTFKIITCASCGYGAFSTILNGRFKWRNSVGHEYWFDRELGICRDCQKVVAIEKLPSKDDFENAKRIFHAGFMKKWVFGRIIADNCRSDAVKNAVRSDSNFDVLEEVMELRRGPVCVTCGSAHISAIPMPHIHNLQGVEPIPTGVLHPSCGGELFIQSSGGTRFTMKMYENVYNTSGQLIERHPKVPFSTTGGS
jgi:hypothetical protein